MRALKRTERSSAQSLRHPPDRSRSCCYPVRHAGPSWPIAVLLEMAAQFAIHPTAVGPIGLASFAAAAVLIERWRSSQLQRNDPADPVVPSEARTTCRTGHPNAGRRGRAGPGVVITRRSQVQILPRHQMKSRTNGPGLRRFGTRRTRSGAKSEPGRRFQPGRIGAPSVTRSRPAMAARNCSTG